MHGVAGRTDVVIDLVAALQLLLVELAEGTLEKLQCTSFEGVAAVVAAKAD